VDVFSAESVIERIASAHREVVALGQVGVVAFDGDGTLWRGDVGEDFFTAVAELGRILPPAVAALRRVGRAAGVGGMDDDHDSGVVLARRLFQAYLDRALPEETICEIIAWVCAGWREDEVLALAQDVVEQGDLAKRGHAELGRVIAWARSNGVETFLVSASPRPVVEAGGAPLGFDRAHVIAATAPFERGVMVADVVRPIPYGPGKATLLAERLGGQVLLAAFGDNIFDIPMLQAARVAVVVEPKPRLRDHLASLKEAGEGFYEGRPPVRIAIA
jgi:phosphatidylglycerophosphatase C